MRIQIEEKIPFTILIHGLFSFGKMYHILKVGLYGSKVWNGLYRSKIDFDSLGLTNKIEIIFDRGREYPVYELGLSKERFKRSKGKKCTFWFNNFFSLICSSMPSNCVKSNSRYDPA